MMTSSILHLFPDTNLFIQCKALDQLDWSAWKAFDEVQLVVSRPVLREIDYRKNKGSDRVGKRARATAALFGEIIKSGQAGKIIRDAGPRVVLSIEPQHNQSKALVDRLNYEERDDQLVGTVYEFAEKNPTVPARLLTHDATPLATARSLGLEAEAIPDDWLLPPESTESEKEIAALKAENVRLRKAEPSFEIACLNSEGAKIERYEQSYAWFDPLTDAEVDSLMHRLKERFLPETDFGRRETGEAAITRFGITGFKQVFVPATDEEIEKYRNATYPQWLSRCENLLRQHHRALQHATPRPSFTFLASNTGMRPAKDALINIEAHGNFEIMLPPRSDRDDDDDDEQQQEKAEPVALPPPPRAPRGAWTTVPAYESALMTALHRSYGSPGYGLNMPDLHRPSFDPSIFRPTPRDPNGFYYKPNRPMMPQSTITLECDQWRHDDGEEHFESLIYISTDQTTVKGALVCRIQAENLSESAAKTIPVRISASRVSAFEHVSALVDTLVKQPQFSFKQRHGKADSAE